MAKPQQSNSHRNVDVLLKSWQNSICTGYDTLSNFSAKCFTTVLPQCVKAAHCMVPNKTPTSLISTCHALVANMSRNVNQILVQLQDCLMQHLRLKEIILDQTPAVAHDTLSFVMISYRAQCPLNDVRGIG